MAWGLCGALLLASLTPVDWSLRPDARHGPGLVRTKHCHSWNEMILNDGSAIVCVSGHTWLYSERRQGVHGAAEQGDAADNLQGTQR